MQSRRPNGQGSEIPSADYAGVPAIQPFDVLQQGPIPEITAAKMIADIALNSVDLSLIGWPLSAGFAGSPLSLRPIYGLLRFASLFRFDVSGS